jgi:hypothetical protein
MGRFMSPDWSAKVEPVPYAKVDDPQSLNLFAFVGNNPLTHVDVDGHDYGQMAARYAEGNENSADFVGESQAQRDFIQAHTDANGLGEQNWGGGPQNSAAQGQQQAAAAPVAQQQYGRQADGSYKADPAKVKAAVDAKKPIHEPGNPDQKAECVFACKALSQMGPDVGTYQWRKGRAALELNDTTDIGLAIATLGSGEYPSQGGNSGIYMGHDGSGAIKIVDQWPNNGPQYAHPFEHTLSRHDEGADMDPRAYYVILVLKP